MLTVVAWCLAALLVSFVVGLVIVRFMPLTAPARPANEPARHLPEQARGAEEPAPANRVASSGRDAPAPRA
jgi:hypothetical protein